MPKVIEKNKQPQLLRGFKDVLPNEEHYWDHVYNAVKSNAGVYGYGKIATPILEETQLYNKTTGETSDIVSKEMFSFKDRGGNDVSLRPEFTPGVMRAYLEHGMFNHPQPVKLWSWGPLFRHDKPQAGRFRQFWQFNFEVIGDASAIIDSQLIILAYKIFNDMGLKVVIQINSIGDKACRPAYLDSLKAYLRSKKSKFCDNCQSRFTVNPLRVFDCKEESCQKFLAEAPQIVDWLCDDCKAHFIQVLENLDDMGVNYNLNPRLVRGLDYYTRTTFEIEPADLAPEQAGQHALGGGGRYDDLGALITKKEAPSGENSDRRETPAVGFACGVERIIMQLREQPGAVPERRRPEIFLAQLGADARKKIMKVFDELAGAGFKVVERMSKDGLKQQLEVANRLKVRLTLILGQKEMLDKTIIIRDMDSGVQEIVDINKVIREVEKRLKSVAAVVKNGDGEIQKLPQDQDLEEDAEAGDQAETTAAEKKDDESDQASTSPEKTNDKQAKKPPTSIQAKEDTGEENKDEKKDGEEDKKGEEKK